MTENLKNLPVKPTDFDKINLIAKYEKTSPAEVIARLLRDLASDADQPPSKGNPAEVDVHVLYRGRKVTGLFNTEAGSLTITSDPLNGSFFEKPSRAAVAVVKALNPGKNSNRNGWTFWRVTATGQQLDSLRVR